MKRIQAHPPVDLIAGALLKGNGPKPLAEQASAAGIPVKKGKVKRYGDKRR